MNFSDKYGRQTRGAPCAGDTHSEEKSYKRKRITELFFWLIRSVWLETGEVFHHFLAGQETQKARVIIVSELSIGHS